MAETKHPHCPRCGGGRVEVDRARRPLVDSLICEDCNYIGPINNPNQPFGKQR